MQSADKLPLLKKSLKMLVEELDPNDKIAIVVYAGSSGLVLDATSVKQKQKIINALDNLRAGGSTAGGAGIQLAYKVAKKNFVKGANNRVILATDGDFNVGVSSNSELIKLIEEKRRDGIFLSVCGFGMGNYQDSKMEVLSNKGNGNYFYIDNIKEAQRVFSKRMKANMFTVAKDVKIQVEFNPAKVASYRLLGYENRKLANQDFNDDKKDAGEVGAGHTVTAVYELVLKSEKDSSPKKMKVDSLKYQKKIIKSSALLSEELMTLKLRYKEPESDESQLLVHPILDHKLVLDVTSDDYRFTAAVIQVGLLLRDSGDKKEASYQKVIDLAKGATGHNDEARNEFISLAETAALLSK